MNKGYLEFTRRAEYFRKGLFVVRQNREASHLFPEPKTSPLHKERLPLRRVKDSTVERNLPISPPPPLSVSVCRLLSAIDQRCSRLVPFFAAVYPFALAIGTVRHLVPAGKDILSSSFLRLLLCFSFCSITGHARSRRSAEPNASLLWLVVPNRCTCYIYIYIKLSRLALYSLAVQRAHI